MEHSRLCKEFKQHLDSLKPSFETNDWVYIGKTDDAFGSPGGSWKGHEGYRFKEEKSKQEYLLRSIPDNGYIVLESYSTRRQVYNMNISKNTIHQNKNDKSILLESFTMTAGKGRVKKQDVKDAFKKLGVESNRVAEVSDNNPNWIDFVTSLLTWANHREEVKKLLKSTSEVMKEEKIDEEKQTREEELNSIPLNQIFFGPPGTGKTYHTVNEALKVVGIDVSELTRAQIKQEFDKKLKEGQIVFTTFHQSMSYEEFIEGIKPVISYKDDDKDPGDIRYEFSDGAFKEFCNRAKEVKIQSSSIEIGKNPTVWNIILDGPGKSDLKKQCFENNYIKIGWDEHDEVITDQSKDLSALAKRILLNFQDGMEIGDIVFTQQNKTTIDGIGIITGPSQFNKDIEGFPRTRNVRWLATDISENILSINQNIKLDRKSVYPLNKINIVDAMELIKKYSKNMIINVEENTKPYVFIIDEINRGNISKIFGELITLIETTKRMGTKEAISAILPYTKEEFSVPNNVYIIGTMNTADRSIALMDTALRRRFKFIEMMPDTSVLIKKNIIEIEGINIITMIEKINERIEILYDREHTIGHAYFTSLVNNATLTNLADIFMNSIIPLLQEYFYEDYSKIQLVLGDNAKTNNDLKFILDENSKSKIIFKGNPDIDLPEKRYTIQTSAFFKPDSYKLIY